MNYYELEPENNTFKTLVVDVTHRCNMECANCYIPNRMIPDMDTNRLYEFAKKLPNRVEFRLMGGEPTVRNDLPEIIRTIRELGHRPTILTNGLRLGNEEYVQKLHDAGLKSLNISMNGADQDSVYKITDELECADRKMAALRNVIKFKMFLNINCIIQKGVNDHIPQRLFNMFEHELNYPVILRFRNVGQLGRFSLNTKQNHTFEDLIRILSKVTGKDIDWIKKWRNVEGFDEEFNLLFPMDESRKRNTTWIKLTDWSPVNHIMPDPGSIRRGRITQDFKIAPFFEHVKMNEGGY